MVKMDTLPQETKIIMAIIQRARAANPDYDGMNGMMDISAVHNTCRLDLVKLFAFDDSNFAHDVFGISRHIDRHTGQLTNCFLPRSAVPLTPAMQEHAIFNERCNP